MGNLHPHTHLKYFIRVLEIKGNCSLVREPRFGLQYPHCDLPISNDLCWALWVLQARASQICRQNMHMQNKINKISKIDFLQLSVSIKDLVDNSYLCTQQNKLTFYPDMFQTMSRCSLSQDVSFLMQERPLSSSRSSFISSSKLFIIPQI